MKNTVEFVKMQGAGNDFVMIRDLEGRFEPDRETISSMCANHRGIGADGLILIRASETADFKMLFFNRDGGEAEMCGNGARCAAMFAMESGVAGKSMVFETGAGLVGAEVLGSLVRIEMGEVKSLKLSMFLEKSGAEIHFTDTGVPHAIILTKDAKGCPDKEFLKIARSVRYDPAIGPRGANFNLVTVRGKNELVYRTYERGVEGETLACGTGAVAAAVVTSHLGLTESPVTCETSGGDHLGVEFDRTTTGAKKCRLTGPAVIVFRGTYISGGNP